jgi:hypothetical protein
MNEVNSKWFYEPNTSSVRRYVDQDKFLFEHADGQRMADALNGCEGINPVAVPDLLAACEAVVQADWNLPDCECNWRGHNSGCLRGSLQDLVTAFAKAKGETP